MDILVLFLIIEEMFSVFHHWEWCLLWVCCIWPLSFEVGSLYAPFLENFYHKWVLNCVKSFFWTYWDDHMVFILQFLDVYISQHCIYTTVLYIWIDFQILKTLHHWYKFHLIIVYDPFNVFLDSIWSYSVENFCFYVQQWYWPVIFFVISWSDFGFSMTVALYW